MADRLDTGAEMDWSSTSVAARIPFTVRGRDSFQQGCFVTAGAPSNPAPVSKAAQDSEANKEKSSLRFRPENRAKFKG